MMLCNAEQSQLNGDRKGSFLLRKKPRFSDLKANMCGVVKISFQFDLEG